MRRNSAGTTGKDSRSVGTRRHALLVLAVAAFLSVVPQAGAATTVDVSACAAPGPAEYVRFFLQPVPGHPEMADAVLCVHNVLVDATLGAAFAGLNVSAPMATGVTFRSLAVTPATNGVTPPGDQISADWGTIDARGTSWAGGVRFQVESAVPRTVRVAGTSVGAINFTGNDTERTLFAVLDRTTIAPSASSNHRPVANADWIDFGRSGRPTRPRVLANDTDPDGDRLKVLRLVRGTRCGKLRLVNGVARFKAPRAGCTTRQRAIYVATDGKLSSNRASIFVMPTIRVAKRPRSTYKLVVRAIDSYSGSAVPAGKAFVLSWPFGVLCPGACSHTFTRNQKVKLTAFGGAQRVFDEWRGGWCSVSTIHCTVTMQNDRSVEAKFFTTTSADAIPPTWWYSGSTKTYDPARARTLCRRGDCYQIFSRYQAKQLAKNSKWLVDRTVRPDSGWDAFCTVVGVAIVAFSGGTANPDLTQPGACDAFAASASALDTIGERQDLRYAISQAANSDSCLILHLNDGKYVAARRSTSGGIDDSCQ
jgi:hypothetical protein